MKGAEKTRKAERAKVKLLVRALIARVYYSTEGNVLRDLPQPFW